jgi:hypothetical protein
VIAIASRAAGAHFKPTGSRVTPSRSPARRGQHES